MQNLLKTALLLSFYYGTNSFQLFGDSNPNPGLWDFNSVLFGQTQNQNQNGLAQKVFIFPGTKWCGVGDIADNDDDYGPERDTDKCCKNHDYCPDFIEAHQTKYGLTNPTFYSRLPCNCDGEFYKCLKSVNTFVSKQVGQLYFTGLGTKCYNKFYPIIGCKRSTFFPKKKCLEYVFDETKEMKYQWFDIPNFS